MSRVVGIEALAGRSAATLRRKAVFVPEWDGDVLLRELTGAERLELAAGVIDLYQVLGEGGRPTSGEDVRRALEFGARVVQAAWIGEDGGQVVGDGEPFEMLLQVEWTILMSLAGEASSASSEAWRG